MDILIEQYSISENPERNTWEETKKRVLEDLSTNFLHQDDKGERALAIAENLPDTWWERRANDEPYHAIRELYQYVDERQARKSRKQSQALPLGSAKAQTDGRARASRFSGGQRRTAPAPAQESVQKTEWQDTISVSVTVDKRSMAVLEKVKEYLEHPENRPPKPFKSPILKEASSLSARSQEDYKRLKKQVLRELKEKGLSTGWDLVLYLVQSAQEVSLSTYKKRRTVILRMLKKRVPGAEALIQALPQYGELCRLLDKTPSRRSTAVTEARRARQNERTFQRLLGHLSDQHRDAILAIRYTGARSSEASSLRLERVAEGIQVSITSAKTGARKKLGESVRTWVVPINAVEGTVLNDILERRGQTPAPFSPHALRSAWHRARVKEGLNQDSHWDLHSLRHQYAGDLKKVRITELRTQHGPDWRRRLYGRDWRDSQRYVEGFYRPIAQRLGHSCAAMAKIYG